MAHRRRSFAALTSLLVALASLLGPPASAQESPRGRISLASQTAWVGDGESFELRVELAGVRRPEALDIVATVHAAVTSRSQFRRTLEGRLLGTELWRSGPSPLPEVGLDAAGTVPFTVPLDPPEGTASPSPSASGPALALEGAGVYPVRVELHRAGTATPIDGFTTYLVRTRDDDAAPLSVAWVQGFASPVALQPDATVALDDGARATLATTAAAVGTSDVPLTLNPRPETLDALAAAAPDILGELAAGLERRQVLAGPYVDVRNAELFAAGLPAVVEAERALGAATVAARLAPTDLDIWVSDGPVDAEVLARSGSVERLVIPEDALVALDRPLTLANPFLVEDADGRRVETAAVDPGLVTHFDQDDPVLGAHHLLADLAVLAYDSPGLERGVVVAPPPSWAPSADFLAAALTALATGPVVRAVTLDGLFEEVPLATVPDGDVLVRALRPDLPLPGSGSLAAADLRRTRADVASAATLLDPTGPTVALLERLALVSAATELTVEEQAAYRAGVGQVIARELDQVGILSEGSFRLTSREAVVPLTLVNDRDTDVDVALALESDKLDFITPSGAAVTGATTMALTLSPGRTPVMVPVEARASGDFPLLITVRSPDGRLEVASTRLTVRSTFPSGVGFLLSAGAGLFLALWWARHWRTARRDRRLVPPPA
jgi:hypothetical protein